MFLASAGLVPVEASTTQLDNNVYKVASAGLVPVEASTTRLAVSCG
ncbi:hypothetical protein BH10PLA2_BH10PLA2_34090 [soil metagenome]